MIQEETEAGAPRRSSLKQEHDANVTQTLSLHVDQ